MFGTASVTRLAPDGVGNLLFHPHCMRGEGGKRGLEGGLEGVLTLGRLFESGVRGQRLAT